MFYVKQAVAKPDRNFKWIDVRSTVEFKRKGGTLAPPTLPYQVTEYALPKPGFKYLNLPKATKKPAEPTASAPARSSSKPLNESRPIRVSSRLTKKADNTRKSDDILSNESFKHGKTADENCTGEDRTDEKEPKRLHPKIENGLYVAEIFAASIALQHVVSYVVNSKLPEYCRPAICQNDPDELVAKLYWPEEQRQGILAKVHDTAGKALKVAGHVPNMAWFQKFEGTSMAKIRRALGIQDPDTEGSSRVLYINVFRKLIPITSLSGDEFLHAWWQVVECHYILWKHDVHHRDVSPSNLMVHWLNGKWIGVLNDHDLSSIQHDGLSGSERTGTVPSMALELLARDAIEGKIKHLYRHDAESFIWVLTWVCLRYENGKLLSEGRPLDDWLRVDAIGCHDKKAGFMQNVKYQHLDIESSPSNEDNCDIAVDCTLTFLEAPANPNPAHSKRPNSKQ